VTPDDLEVLIDIYLDTAATTRRSTPRSSRSGPRRDRRPPAVGGSSGRGESGEYVAAMLGDVMVGSASVDIAGPAVGRQHGPRGADRPSLAYPSSRGYRGHGIGRALIEHLERWAADHGVERMILTVSEANEGAIRLYHELGYRDFDRMMLKR
jgi:GNAT superfamily N-acetyltransferase